MELAGQNDQRRNQSRSIPNRQGGVATRDCSIGNALPRQVAAVGRQDANDAEPDASRVGSGEYVAMLPPSAMINHALSTQNNATHSASAARSLEASTQHDQFDDDDGDDNENNIQVTKLHCSSDV